MNIFRDSLFNFPQYKFINQAKLCTLFGGFGCFFSVCNFSPQNHCYIGCNKKKNVCLLYGLTSSSYKHRNVFHLTGRLGGTERSALWPHSKMALGSTPQGPCWGLSLATFSLRLLSPASFRGPKKQGKKKNLLMNSATSQTPPQAAHILISWPNEAGRLSAKPNRGVAASKLLLFFSFPLKSSATPQEPFCVGICVCSRPIADVHSWLLLVCGLCACSVPALPFERMAVYILMVAERFFHLLPLKKSDPGVEILSLCLSPLNRPFRSKFLNGGGRNPMELGAAELF